LSRGKSLPSQNNNEIAGTPYQSGLLQIRYYTSIYPLTSPEQADFYTRFS